MELDIYVFLRLDFVSQRVATVSHKVKLFCLRLLQNCRYFWVLEQTFSDEMGGGLMLLLRATDDLVIKHLLSEDMADILRDICPDSTLVERIRFIVHG